jgi:hypothetical protein
MEPPLHVIHGSLAFEQIFDHIQCEADDDKENDDCADSSDGAHGFSPLAIKATSEHKL